MFLDNWYSEYYLLVEGYMLGCNICLGVDLFINLMFHTVQGHILTEIQINFLTTDHGLSFNQLD